MRSRVVSVKPSLTSEISLISLRNTWVTKRLKYFRGLMEELDRYREEDEDYD